MVDARDPLLYRSKDLEAHAREVHASKSSFILLNKSDLLPPHVRAAWADYFDEVRVRGQRRRGEGRGAGRQRGLLKPWGSRKRRAISY